MEFLWPVVAIVVGLPLLVWSADRFVDGAAAISRRLGVPPLVIGMVVVGFGTSMPEMVVSALSAGAGEPSLALGNAYGSNIANIALILGVTALISPIAVHSQILRKELPVLSMVTGLAVIQLWDGGISRLDAVVLLGVFGLLMVWTVRQALRSRADALAGEVEQELASRAMSPGRATFWLAVGLGVMVASSRMLVWGAASIANVLGVSKLIIGLTVVAVGTSLPELASSIMAARKGEHDLALGNILGSNLFNTLAVVGIAGAISPMSVGAEVLNRDLLVMAVLTLSLFGICYGFKGPGRINRYEGAALLASYAGYTVWLVQAALAGRSG